MGRTYPVPFDESQRLEVLHSYSILDSGSEPEFEQLANVVARHFGVPVVLISLIDESRQWFKCHLGLETEETDRDLAFCNYAILDEKVFVVLDAAEDPRFSDNALVTGPPHIRFYAGAPLITPAGFKIGTVCLIDDQPWQAFSAEQAADLEEFAVAAMDRIAARNPEPQKTAAVEGDAMMRAVEETQAYLAQKMREPIHAIVGLAEAVQLAVEDGQVDAECEQHLERIRRIGDDLSTLIDRTLSLGRLSRFGQRGLRMEETPVPLGAFVQDLLDRLHPGAERKGVAFRVRQPPEIVLEADRTKLDRMCDNLAQNAIAYTPGGGHVEIAFEQATDGALEIVVSDDGPGMSEAQVMRAFGPLSRMSEAGAGREAPGGMGLPLTRRLVELHGGRLVLDSESGKGTRARLFFPAHRISAAIDETA